MRSSLKMLLLVTLLAACGDAKQSNNVGVDTSTPNNTSDVGSSDANNQGDGTSSDDMGASDMAPTDDMAIAEMGADMDDDTGTVDMGPDMSLPPAATMLSYLGGNSSQEIVGDQGRDVAFDAAGNMFVTGGIDRHLGAPFDGPNGRIIGTNHNRNDIFVVSFDPDGNLRYATLIGGPGYDRSYSIEVDPLGNAFIAGRAGQGFPTTAGVLQEQFAGDNTPNGAYGTQDGVVIKLDPAGDLDWATYVGDPGLGFIRDIDIDDQGRVYAAVAGANQQFPHVTSGSFIDVPPTGRNTVVLRLSADGSTLDWGGYLGGSGDEASPPAIDIGPDGDVYVVWASGADDVPVTAGAYQTTRGGGDDLVVARISGDGQTLKWCTFFGGTDGEHVETHQIAVNAAGEPVVTMAVNSTVALPGTPYQAMAAGGRDLLIAKLSADGTQLLAATFLGGNQDEHSEGVAFDATGRIVVTGGTQSTNFPTTAGAFQTAHGAMGDGLLAVLSADLSTLEYSTLFAGNGGDEARAAAVAPDGTVATTGRTTSTDLPSQNALQSNYGGGSHDAWFTRIDPN